MDSPKKGSTSHNLVTFMISRHRPNLTWLRLAWLRSVLTGLVTFVLVFGVCHLCLYPNSVIECHLGPSVSVRAGDPAVDGSALLFSSEDSFTSPLVVTENDWPLTKHLVPISLKSALGLPSDETSATRPITVAYVRACENYKPGCFVDEPQNYSLACPYPGLKQTHDWNTADIVVMNVWRFMGELSLPHIKRPLGQIWVMLSTEAPSRRWDHEQLDYPEIKGQFNWTMSYRLDADIPFPYGYLVRRDNPVARDFEAVYDAKRFHAAWLVSHCKTSGRRERYVTLLQWAGLDVHIYGLCGNYSCEDGTAALGPGSEKASDKVCMPRVTQKYFFYLAFENFLCSDYISEKMFKIYKDVDTIPVVRGGADYTALFPPNTFVDASNFSSAEELVKYLVRLANDKERYLGMLKAKWEWLSLPRNSWFCTLGEQLAKGHLGPQVIPDARLWYTTGQCHNSTDIPRHTKFT